MRFHFCGGTLLTPIRPGDMFQKLDAPKNLKNFVFAFDYPGRRSDCNGKFGTVDSAGVEAWLINWR